ncbi:RagB/SusD family nutrient uptake outer membrane protein [Limibacter armeniacum]|uniref:RagB/SusD family nutrient uptake outer membrane protein n=1 Tax=Limibacter armeniacum TaxID=466084 RepID=UPI002FE56B84
MNIKNFIYGVSILACAGLSSCEEQLDLMPISQETQDNAYTRGSQVEAALVGVYESFQSSDYYTWDNVLLQDVRSDNYYAGGDNAEIFAFDYLNITPTNSRIQNMWGNIYNAIAKANVVLERAPQVEDPLFSGERKAQVIGEAYFLRAYHYYNLVKMFGGVPLMLETVKSVEPEDIHVARSTEAEVYAQIIKDLEEALTRLPDTYGADASVNKARATKGAANALLCKVYAQKSSPDYDKVKQYADAVINSSAGYQLLGNYADLFDGNHYNNAESIMEVQFLGSNEGNWAPQMHLPPSVSGDTWRKFTTPSHDLINAYDALGDDVRKDATVLFESAPWVDEFWNNEINSEIPFAYKWKNASGWASADRQYIFRLGDIILMKAEALNELGNPAGAADLVDQIRDRVGLALVDAADRNDQAAMKKVILNERRLELAQEAQRWDDLIRNGVVLDVMNNLNEVDLRTGEKVNYNATEDDLLLPIPQQELDRNPALVQN